jgi:hypothetical protein
VSFEPPDDVLPITFPLDLLLARTDSVAVVVHGGRAYPDGFEFVLTLRSRDGRIPEPWLTWRGGEISGDVLRFGIAFADGRKASVFDPPPWRPNGEPDIALIQRGGNGGGSSWEMRFWVSPLPPDGPVAFVAEWPAKGIAFTQADADGASIRDAAGRAQALWGS